MNRARFVLSPYYEIIDQIVPITRLVMDENTTLDNSGRLRCTQWLEFSVSYSHSELLCESRRQNRSSFNVRCIIRFGRVEEMWCDEYGTMVKDSFPLHLYLDLNNAVIDLPHLLPHDRYGKDGRRYPRPVEITQGFINDAGAKNVLLINWAQYEAMQEQYYCALYLVRVRSCDELTTILLSRRICPMATTQNLVYEQCLNLNGIVDDDLALVNSSINTSLNCPVSRGRMNIPIRGQSCTHLQCFDCMTYLVINCKKPTWLCPVCDKKTFFCYLEVDGLLFNILKDERSRTTENVQFNKSGQWRPERKIPGCVKDDGPFYDITEFIEESQLSKSTTINSSLRRNEFTDDYKVEDNLQEIFNSSETQSSMTFNGHSSNLNQQDNVNPLMVSRNEYVKRENETLNTVASNISLPLIPKVEGTITSNCSNVPPIFTSESLNTQQLMENPSSQYRDNNLSHSLLFNGSRSSIIDTLPQLQIIDVRSMAKDREDLIVDEQWPSLLSHSPIDSSLFNQVPVSNGANQHYHELQSSPNSDMRYQHIPPRCTCASGILCPFHNNCLTYRSCLFPRGPYANYPHRMNYSAPYICSDYSTTIASVQNKSLFNFLPNGQRILQPFTSSDNLSSMSSLQCHPGNYVSTNNFLQNGTDNAIYVQPRLQQFPNRNNLSVSSIFYPVLHGQTRNGMSDHGAVKKIPHKKKFTTASEGTVIDVSKSTALKSQIVTPKTNRLTMTEKYIINEMVRCNKNQTEIAVSLNRSRSCIQTYMRSLNTAKGKATRKQLVASNSNSPADDLSVYSTSSYNNTLGPSKVSKQDHLHSEFVNGPPTYNCDESSRGIYQSNLPLVSPQFSQGQLTNMMNYTDVTYDDLSPASLPWTSYSAYPDFTKVHKC